jgi:hypothetical protein
MKTPFKMKPGRGNMPKTGKDIPLNMKSPMYMEGPGEDDDDKKAKIGEVPGFEEIKKRFEGRYTVIPKRGKTNEYSLINKNGLSVSYKPGKNVEDKSKSVIDILNSSIKSKK